jgi:hypothetical protein
MGCPACGDEDGVRHGSVLAFARMLSGSALVGLVLLIGIITVGLAIAKA